MTTTRWKVGEDDGYDCEVWTDESPGSVRIAVCNGKERVANATKICTEHNAHVVNEHARLTLEGLTPGGSEYVNDPERCAAYIQRIKTECVEANKDNVRLKRVNAAMLEALEAVAMLTRFELPELNNTDNWKRNLIDIEGLTQAALRLAQRGE